MFQLQKFCFLCIFLQKAFSNEIIFIMNPTDPIFPARIDYINGDNNGDVPDATTPFTPVVITIYSPPEEKTTKSNPPTSTAPMTTTLPPSINVQTTLPSFTVPSETTQTTTASTTTTTTTTTASSTTNSASTSSTPASTITASTSTPTDTTTSADFTTTTTSRISSTSPNNFKTSTPSQGETTTATFTDSTTSRFYESTATDPNDSDKPATKPPNSTTEENVKTTLSSDLNPQTTSGTPSATEIPPEATTTKMDTTTVSRSPMTTSPRSIPPAFTSPFPIKGGDGLALPKDIQSILEKLFGLTDVSLDYIDSKYPNTNQENEDKRPQNENITDGKAAEINPDNPFSYQVKDVVYANVKSALKQREQFRTTREDLISPIPPQPIPTMPQQAPRIQTRAPHQQISYQYPVRVPERNLGYYGYYNANARQVGLQYAGLTRQMYQPRPVMYRQPRRIYPVNTMYNQPSPTVRDYNNRMYMYYLQNYWASSDDDASSDSSLWFSHLNELLDSNK